MGDLIADNPFSAVGAASELQARQNKVKAAVDAADPAKKKPKKKTGARKKQAQPLSEIKKTKHTGSEGEASYGQRMQEPAMEQQKTRFNQTGDDAGDWDD